MVTVAWWVLLLVGIGVFWFGNFMGIVTLLLLALNLDRVQKPKRSLGKANPED